MASDASNNPFGSIEQHFDVTHNKVLCNNMYELFKSGEHVDTILVAGNDKKRLVCIYAQPANAPSMFIDQLRLFFS